MSRRKKGHKIKKLDGLSPSSIHFEIEENAEELILRHLEEFKPVPKDADPDNAGGPAKKAKAVRKVIDLHGMVLSEAEAHLERELHRLLAEADRIELKIVTGKGRHSENRQGILVKEIHRFVLQRFREFIRSIEESPDKLRLRGEPIRGHFHVILQGRKG